MCDDQKEIGYYWEKLGQGGDPNAQQCAWLKDKFGLSWQVVPKVLTEMLKGKDQKVNEAVMKVMLQLKKLDIAALKKAYKEAEAVPTGRR
jgi:predicted 3-demethylubiquinone-9 3-methyltransferase (glyoxalase superfamily)